MEIIKTTKREFLAKSEEQNNYRIAANSAHRNADYSLQHELEQKADKLDEEYFSKINTVNVSFYIGSRSYYRNVFKIGKSYFMHGDTMTAKRGYSSITEIDEITDEMEKEMLDDSYYY